MMAPTVHSIPSTPAVIGAAHEMCLEGNTGGTNGTNFWTLDGSCVNAIDISDLTNEGNSNITHPTSPLCDICSCYKKYLSVGGIGQRIGVELERAGFAAFIVTMYQLDGVATINVKSQLCYGVRNRYLSVLLVRSVGSSEGGQTNVSFTITSAEDLSTTKRFNLATSESPSVEGA